MKNPNKTVISTDQNGTTRALIAGLMVAIIWLALLLSACDTVETASFESDIVVEAFLYAGEPVDDIHLTWSIPLDEEEAEPQPINDATVRLFGKGEEYTLTLAPGDSGYYHYDGDDLFVSTGDTWRIEVAFLDQIVSGETTVPEPPREIELSEEEMILPEMGGGFGRPTGGRRDNTLTITWENPDNSFYFVVVESRISGEPEYVLPDFIRDRFAGFRMVTEPTDRNYYDLPFMSVEVYGKHEVILYRVNKEYADLYQNRDQDSRDLNEPPSNIEGGLGVFSAFNSVRKEFTVVKGEEEGSGFQ